jgi:recombinational DNA repair protein RecR
LAHAARRYKSCDACKNLHGQQHSKICGQEQSGQDYANRKLEHLFAEISAENPRGASSNRW